MQADVPATRMPVFEKFVDRVWWPREEIGAENYGPQKCVRFGGRQTKMSVAEWDTSCLCRALSIEHAHRSELQGADHSTHARRRSLSKSTLSRHMFGTQCSQKFEGAEQVGSTSTTTSHRILLWLHLQRPACRPEVFACCCRNRELSEIEVGKQNDIGTAVAPADAYNIHRFPTSQHAAYGSRGMESGDQLAPTRPNNGGIRSHLPVW